MACDTIHVGWPEGQCPTPPEGATGVLFKSEHEDHIASMGPAWWVFADGGVVAIIPDEILEPEWFALRGAEQVAAAANLPLREV